MSYEPIIKLDGGIKITFNLDAKFYDNTTGATAMKYIFANDPERKSTNSASTGKNAMDPVAYTHRGGDGTYDTYSANHGFVNVPSSDSTGKLPVNIGSYGQLMFQLDVDELLKDTDGNTNYADFKYGSTIGYQQSAVSYYANTDVKEGGNKSPFDDPVSAYYQQLFGSMGMPLSEFLKANESNGYVANLRNKFQIKDKGDISPRGDYLFQDNHNGKETAYHLVNGPISWISSPYSGATVPKDWDLLKGRGGYSLESEITDESKRRAVFEIKNLSSSDSNHSTDTYSDGQKIAGIRVVTYYDNADKELAEGGIEDTDTVLNTTFSETDGLLPSQWGSLVAKSGSSTAGAIYKTFSDSHGSYNNVNYDRYKNVLKEISDTDGDRLVAEFFKIVKCTNEADEDDYVLRVLTIPKWPFTPVKETDKNDKTVDGNPPVDNDDPLTENEDSPAYYTGVLTSTKLYASSEIEVTAKFPPISGIIFAIWSFHNEDIAIDQQNLYEEYFTGSSTKFGDSGDNYLPNPSIKGVRSVTADDEKAVKTVLLSPTKAKDSDAINACINENASTREPSYKSEWQYGCGYGAPNGGQIDPSADFADQSVTLHDESDGKSNNDNNKEGITGSIMKSSWEFFDPSKYETGSGKNIKINDYYNTDANDQPDGQPFVGGTFYRDKSAGGGGWHMTRNDELDIEIPANNNSVQDYVKANNLPVVTAKVKTDSGVVNVPTFNQLWYSMNMNNYTYSSTGGSGRIGYINLSAVNEKDSNENGPEYKFGVKSDGDDKPMKYETFAAGRLQQDATGNINATVIQDNEWHTYKIEWHAGDRRKKEGVDEADYSLYDFDTWATRPTVKYYIDGKLVSEINVFVPVRYGRWTIGAIQTGGSEAWRGPIPANLVMAHSFIKSIKITPFNEYNDDWWPMTKDQPYLIRSQTVATFFNPLRYMHYNNEAPGHGIKNVKINPDEPYYGDEDADKIVYDDSDDPLKTYEADTDVRIVMKDGGWYSS